MSDDYDKSKNELLENPEEIEAGMEASGQASEELPSPAEDEHLESASSNGLLDIKETIESKKWSDKGVESPLLVAIQTVIAPKRDEELQLKNRELQLKEKELKLTEAGQGFEKKKLELIEKEQKLKKEELRLKTIGILYTILWPALVLICRYSDEIFGFFGKFLGD